MTIKFPILEFSYIIFPIRPDGENYVGEFKNGKFNGHGKLTWSDGKKYVGEWKNGKRNGQGTQTWLDGRKYVGEYKDGKTWNRTGYDKNGNIQIKFVNGESIE